MKYMSCLFSEPKSIRSIRLPAHLSAESSVFQISMFPLSLKYQSVTWKHNSRQKHSSRASAQINGLQQFVQLRSLCVHACLLTRIEANVLQSCICLVDLNLSSNKIEKIEGLSLLKQLQSLNLASAARLPHRPICVRTRKR